MEEILAAVRELGAQIASLENRVAAMDGRLTAMDGRVGAMDGRVGAMDERIVSMEGRFPAIDARVTTVDGRFDEVMRFLRAQPDIKLLLVRQKATMEEQRAMRGDIVMIKSQMNDFHKLRVTEGEIEALHEAVSRTTEEQYMLSARLDAVEKA